MKRTLALLVATLFVLSCARGNAAPMAAEGGDDPATPTNAETSVPGGAASAASSAERNLLAFASGALIVRPPENQGWFDGSYGPYNMLDDDTTNVWSSPHDDTKREQAMVVAVPVPTLFERFEFDAAPAGEHGVKRVRIEISNQSADAGFKQLAVFSLEQGKDAQGWSVDANEKARWVRFTFTDSHSGKELSLGNIRATGTQDVMAALADVSGTYNFEGEQPWHIVAEGSSISGCYEGNYGGLLSGGVEGQTIKLRWTENQGNSGAMLVNYAPGGEAAVFVWTDGDDPQKPVGPNIRYGRKVSDEVGSCEHWSSKGNIDQRLASELERKGRAIVYGIHFDTDSDVIRADSHPTLQKIVALLKAKNEWKLSIEGHTDSTASAEHNQKLSERRAAAVKQFLVEAGIDAGRLMTVGRGAGNPVARNDTPSGRAQNRRVELVKSP